ncbi:unnamed protein product [Leptosia nina]|uniref:NADP-dependent oxidoreductase domain-containing protein n=1 Tax=Leptosia nina TaxID=320188 RepID=A0AAV1IXC2_9NEOP
MPLLRKTILLLFIVSVFSHKSFYRTLNDGNKIPSIAMGTFSLKNPKQSVLMAVKAGFRHIDTAKFYRNEYQVGQAIHELIETGVVTRDELFITGKLENEEHDRKQVKPGLEGTLKRLGLKYIDLYLIHSPMATGVNQNYPNLGLLSYCLEHNIQVMAYAPFGFMVPRFVSYRPIRPKIDDPYLTKLGEKYGKDTTQIVLRYLIDRNTIPIPRSDNHTHITSNIDVFDFSLTQNEILNINEFNIDTKVYVLGALKDHRYYSFNTC